MASKIEQTIDEIEELISNCKPAPFSANNIVVNRDQIESLVEELRSRTPVEIKQYQRILVNQEQIYAEANRKAEAIISQAQEKTTKLVEKHEIMRQAYEIAQRTVNEAEVIAQKTVDEATARANEITGNAIAYTDNILGLVEQYLQKAIESTQSHVKEIDDLLSIVVRNRTELAANPPQ